MNTPQGSPPASTPASSKVLKFAEYTSLAASVFGAIASATTQQIAYAAAPLTVSLALNLANRQRFEQQVQQQMTTAIAQVDKSLVQLNRRMTQLQKQVPTDLHQQTAQLAEQHSTVLDNQIDLAASAAEFEANLAQLSQQFNQNIRDIQLQFALQPNPVSPATVKFIEQSLEKLTGRICEFEASLAQLPQQFTQDIQEIQRQLALELESVSPTTIKSIDQLLEQLAERLSDVEGQTRQLRSHSSGADTDALDAIHQSIQQLVERLSAIEALQLKYSRGIAESTALILPAPQVSQSPPPPPAEDEGLEELHLNLGIDFGTSFTKVCFRDVARNRSEIVTFVEDAADLEESLLPTQVGILPDGTLVAGLTASEWKAYQSKVETTIEFIKMRLAGLDLAQQKESWRLDQLPKLDQPEMVENLCIYYLSRVINRTQSWIRRNKPELIVNQRIEWSANVGVPVAYCDSPAIARFEKVLSLAWLLSNEPQTEWFTLESLTTQMNRLRSELDPDCPTPCYAVPEIAAEAWSFFNSREADDGFYVFFDIGDGTMDGAAFYYCREEGEPKVDFYAAQVEPLGVTVFSRLLAQELKWSTQQVKEIICDRSSEIKEVTFTEASKQIQKLVASVVVKGKKQHEGQFPGHRRPGTVKPDFQDHLEVFVGGGGSTTSFYHQTITATHVRFQQSDAGIPSYLVKTLPLPKDLMMHPFSNREFHRFAVAYGLSLPIYEGAQVRLPSQVAADQTVRGKVRYPQSQSKYMDTKDLC